MFFNFSGKIIDITLPIHEGMIIYPGNPDVSIVSRKGSLSTISEITMGSHTGTHIDAPKHVFDTGKAIDEISLEKFIGPCRVLDMTHTVESVGVSDLEKQDIKEGERILVKTKNSEIGFEKFRDDYIYLHGEAAEFLAERRISLFGIDYLSVKKRGGDDLRPHTVLLEKEIPIFEGLNLRNLAPGNYTFIGFPLLIPGIDGAPARAVLISE